MVLILITQTSYIAIFIVPVIIPPYKNHIIIGYFYPFIATHTVRLIRKTKRFFALLSLLLLAPHFLFAQEKGTKVSQEVIKIQPLEGEIELDGIKRNNMSQIVPFQ